MQIILIQNVPGLGRAGETKSAAGGYARNYLIPRGLAIRATPKSKQVLEEKTRQKSEKLASEKAAAEELKSKIENLPAEIELKKGEQNEIFGSVNRIDLHKFLAKQEINLSKNAIELEKPIKKPGEYPISIKLHPEICATLRLIVK